MLGGKRVADDEKGTDHGILPAAHAGLEARYQFRSLKQADVRPWGSLFKNETLPARTLKKLPSKAADADWENAQRHSAEHIPRWPFGRLG